MKKSVAAIRVLIVILMCWAGARLMSTYADEGSLFCAERAQYEQNHNLNVLPEKFEDRLLFPTDRQAIISAEWDIDLSLPDVDLARGELAGLKPMPERQVQFAGNQVQDVLNRRFNEPVKLRLSKFRYPYEDRHLDAIVWTTPPAAGHIPGGHIEVLLKDSGGNVLASHRIDELSRSGLFFSVGFPPQLEGSRAALEVVWRDGRKELGRAMEVFHVREASGVATSGRIPLRLLNEPGAVVSGAPMTTGVPFPHGALADESNVRLVDENGRDVPLQTRLTARWSRYGPVKWLLCDFTADLSGGPREFYLDYGPDIRRREHESITVLDREEGFPALNAGRIRVGDKGVEFDAAGDGTFRPVLSAGALHGAFVEHENALRFTVPRGGEHAIEEIGSEKVVVRRTGWYEHQQSGEQFCQYVTRFVFHRDSPVMRIFHTWIFTGDGNRDRIANMGWRFGASGTVESEGFLTSFDDGHWAGAENLVQFDYREYDLLGGTVQGRFEGRNPGVMSGSVGGARVLFGAKDFWQNFPSELEVGEDGFTFYNWPKNNPRATYERPVARQDAFRHRFVHEGELLDFRIPDEYAEGDLWEQCCSREGHWAEGRPETANAQGIARTEEMFLYFADRATSRAAAARVMRGLNDETLRAVVDPVWMTSSGVFSQGGIDIHPIDREKFPEVERAYELRAGAPARWVERLGVYGMWVFGDYPTWGMNLPNRTVSTYRTYRKNHGDSPGEFPYRLIPFIRSGNPQFLKLAENGARQMADANFCHYATEDVDRMVGPDHYRRQGWWDRSLLQWAGRFGPHLRSYTIDTDYLWDTHYVTGYARTRDVALLFSELTKHAHETASGGRGANQWLKSYIDMYKATFDPWFLNAAYEVSHLHVHNYRFDGEMDPLMYDHPRNIVGFEHWRWADQIFHDFTGRDDYQDIARNSARGYANPNMVVARAGTGTDGGAATGLSAHSWRHTGDPFYLGRLSASLDRFRYISYDGDIEWMLGPPHTSHGWHAGGAASGEDLGIPMVMSVLSKLETIPEPIHDLVWLPDGWPGSPDAAIHIRHEEDGPFDLNFYVRGAAYPKRPFQYAIAGANGFHDSRNGVTPETVAVSGGKGIYRVEAGGDIDRLYLPIARFDIPEVIGFRSSEDGTSIRAPQLGYWFHVPEGVKAFWIDFTVMPSSRYTNRISVWNPEGRRAWDLSYSREDNLPGRVKITVPAGQDGKLWRATGGSFVIDPQIPPYFSLSPRKWFNPDKD